MEIRADRTCHIGYRRHDRSNHGFDAVDDSLNNVTAPVIGLRGKSSDEADSGIESVHDGVSDIVDDVRYAIENAIEYSSDLVPEGRHNGGNRTENSIPHGGNRAADGIYNGNHR